MDRANKNLEEGMFELSKQNFRKESRKRVKEFLLDRLFRIVLWLIIGAVVAFFVPTMSSVAIGICGGIAMIHLFIGVVVLPILAFDRFSKYQKFLKKQ